MGSLISTFINTWPKEEIEFTGQDYWRVEISSLGHFDRVLLRKRRISNSPKVVSKRKSSVQLRPDADYLRAFIAFIFRESSRLFVVIPLRNGDSSSSRLEDRGELTEDLRHKVDSVSQFHGLFEIICEIRISRILKQTLQSSNNFRNSSFTFVVDISNLYRYFKDR